MSRRAPLIRERDGAIAVEFEAHGGPAELRLDRVSGAHPRWIGSAEDLDVRADRRTAAAIIDVLTEFGRERAESVALYHADGRLEWLVEPSQSTPG